MNVCTPLPIDTTLTGSIPSHIFGRPKLDSQGNVIDVKFRMVAGGDRQVTRFQLTDTFAPTVETSTINIILQIASNRNLELTAVDLFPVLKQDV